MGEPRRHLLTFLLRVADDHLVLGHRLSEWCGHAPMLEEDLALPNIALDLIGQARALYQYAAEVEGRGRSEDDFAYLRAEREYLNCLLVERPNGDFAHTMLRQFIFSAYMKVLWEHLLTSSDETLAAIAGKAVKEVAYHLRHSGEWVIRLGDGTEESAGRMREAMEALATHVDELFQNDEVSAALAANGIAPEPEALRPGFERLVRPVLAEARLEWPSQVWPRQGGRQGRHSEAMGYLLAELQYMQRAHPGASW